MQKCVLQPAYKQIIKFAALLRQGAACTPKRAGGLPRGNNTEKISHKNKKTLFPFTETGFSVLRTVGKADIRFY